MARKRCDKKHLYFFSSIFFRTVLHHPYPVRLSVLLLLNCELPCLVQVSFFLFGPQIGMGKKQESSLSVCNYVKPLDGTSSLLTAHEESAL